MHFSHRKAWKAYHIFVQNFIIFIVLRQSFSLNPFWNRWLSLQSDWLSAVRFIHKSHNFRALHSIFFSANENKTVKQNNHSHDIITSRWHGIDMFSKWDVHVPVNAFLVSLFDKPAIGSIYYGTVWNLVVFVFKLLNCVISKWM